ncbi:ATP-dependent DNA ligase [Dyadobacter tibetensis]|uniref:ATP-dependent DNA ligase n=1 Tax=Dyadobacter tibetensis TaxID=1211851 RepID=UPI000471D2A7|nr:ATP-dependent DNA ligase [Dyadobacter tibetensis]
MKRFSELFSELDRTNKTNTKVSLLKNYFMTATDEDKLWALTLFTGRRPSFKINRKQVREWATEVAQIPEWLFQESYQNVGDLGETISLLLPPTRTQEPERSLSEWFDYLGKLPSMDEEKKKEMLLAAWEALSPQEIFVFNKLLMGSFRIGVSQSLVVRALAEATGQPTNVLAHRIMGDWNPDSTNFYNLIHAENLQDQDSRPYPFYLAYPIEADIADLGEPEEWFAEWKWDGIRSQIIVRNQALFIWTRGEELATEKFPELHFLVERLPHGTVLDAEIVAWADGKPLPFQLLQTRIGRKSLTKKTLSEAPIGLLVYDLLEWKGQDLREKPIEYRRSLMEQLLNADPFLGPVQLSPLIEFSSWDDLRELHPDSRSRQAEGFMLKRKSGPYRVGRKKGDWWKWKVDPLTIDAVLIYAQRGSGRRAEQYTDYTFALWDQNGKLIPFAKAYSGLTDKEIGQVDYFIKRNIVEKFGPVRTVKPELVFEIGFEGIGASSRHKSGIAVRFPRILRWRKDKTAQEADTLDSLKQLLVQYGL